MSVNFNLQENSIMYCLIMEMAKKYCQIPVPPLFAGALFKTLLSLSIIQRSILKPGYMVSNISMLIFGLSVRKENCWKCVPSGMYLYCRERIHQGFSIILK